MMNDCQFPLSDDAKHVILATMYIVQCTLYSVQCEGSRKKFFFCVDSPLREGGGGKGLSTKEKFAALKIFIYFVSDDISKY